MRSANNNLALTIVAIACLLCSIPMQWMVLKNPPMRIQGLGSLGHFPGELKVTGLNGSLGLPGVRLPIWFLVVVGVVGSVLAMLNYLSVCSLPRLALLAPPFISGLFIVVATGLTPSGHISLSAGFFLWLVGILVGIIASVRFGKVGEPPVQADT